MPLYLGIDGGGTKTKIIIIDEKRLIRFENISGPSSVDTVDTETTFNNIKKAILPFLTKNSEPFHGIFAGMGGIVFDKQKEELVKVLRNLPNVNDETVIIAENDMYNALYSGLMFDEGMALICGTGMVAFGKDLTGKSIKCGGWGYKEGEYGSGFSLGMDAVRYMIRSFDGRLLKDEFSLEIANALNFTSNADIIPLLDELYNDRTRVASLATIVTKHANNNHPYALTIIENATDEVALAVKGVLNGISLDHKQLVVVGSLGNIEGQFKRLLQQKIRLIDGNISIISPIIDPAHAAALYIYNFLNK